MRVAVDSGGTFTDCVYVEDGRLAMRKVLSTPGDPSAAILSVMDEVSGEAALVSVRHGTTVGTNAMLERKGARVAFVTTTGFEDVIAIGRQARASLYDWFWSPPACIVPAALRFGVHERTTAEGVVLRSPGKSELDELCAAIARSGADSIALSLLFSFANAANELLVAEALAGLGLPLSISSRILPEFREYERGATICVNAYLAPLVGTYLRELSKSLCATYASANLHVMQSSGGIVAAELAADEPVRTVLSGPAGGVMGAYRVGLLAGFEKLITFDMGGTSTDLALIDASAGGPQTTNEAVIAGMPIAVPMLDIHTVGAGGGSIARYDAGGILHVGPESAGAMPGPICYGRGEAPTVTDANLLLGRLDNFLGGSMAIDEPRTREFASKYLSGAGTLEELADGIVLVAEAAMEKAIRVISVERGYDPREFTLLAFGGAGPLHACALARSISIPRVLVPKMPGALSALGILLADAVRDYSKTVMLRYGSEFDELFSELEARARQECGAEAVMTRTLDLRYVGQGYEVNVAAGADALDRFHDAHDRRYGYADATRAVEVVTVRVRATISEPAVEFATENYASGDGLRALVKRRGVYFNGMVHETPVYARERLRHGDEFAGPALISEYSATTVVGPQDRVSVDGYGNLIVEVGRA
jgi:N-methylhydantoinase A